MPKVSEQVLIPHTAADLYELVRDIRRYPDFIRWIRDLRVSDEQGSADTPYTCLGEASVHFKGFDETFATRVEADPLERKIDVSLVRGPFRRLRNRWQFQPINPLETRVHFFIDYEFKNPVLGLLARANTRLAVDKIIAAFRAEADRRYG